MLMHSIGARYCFLKFDMPLSTCIALGMRVPVCSRLGVLISRNPGTGDKAYLVGLFSSCDRPSLAVSLSLSLSLSPSPHGLQRRTSNRL